MDEVSQEAQDKARSASLSDEADTLGTVEVVEHKGVKYEVRAPTLADNHVIQRKATDKSGEVNELRRGVLALIHCVYYPGTNKRVFSMADEEALMNKRPTPGTFIAKILLAMKKIQTLDAEAEEKN